MLLTRKALVGLGIILCAPIGFAVANGIADPPPPQPPHGELQPGGLAGVRGTDSIERVTRDPSGKGRDWAVTVFKAKNGQDCVAPGRKVGQQVGDVAPDGSFTPYPIEDGATCADLSAVPAGVQVTTDMRGEPRTMVYGLAGPKVRSISIGVDGTKEDVSLGPRGAFLRVLGPEIQPPASGRPPAVSVTATLKDGSVVPLLG